MARVNKFRKQTSTSIDIELLATLDELSQEQRIEKSRLYDEALKLLFEKYNKDIVKVNDKAN